MLQLQRYIKERGGTYEYTNAELRIYVAENSEAQLRFEIAHMLVHGLVWLPLVMAIEILHEKQGWDEMSWNKAINFCDSAYPISYLSAAIRSHGGFEATRQLSIEFLLLAGATITTLHREDVGSDGEFQYSKEPYDYVLGKCKIPAAKRSENFIENSSVYFEKLHSLNSMQEKMDYIHGLFVTHCCKSWKEGEFQAVLKDGGVETFDGFQPTDMKTVKSTSALSVERKISFVEEDEEAKKSKAPQKARK
jgi:hypothetical protein